MKNTTASAQRIKIISHQLNQFLKKSDVPACFFDQVTAFGNGMCTFLSSNPDMPHYYFSTRHPFAFTNKAGRTLPNGIYLSHFFEKHTGWSTFLTKLQNRFAFQHSLSIAVNKKDQQHLYSFYFNCSETIFLQHVINHLYRYEQIIAQYHHDFSDIIDNEYEKHQLEFPLLDIPLLNNNSFSLFDDKDANKIITPENIDKELTHHLSPQQIKCLSFLVKGMSSKDISVETQLSHRTIEHYIAAIKLKLNAKNAKELIARCASKI